MRVAVPSVPFEVNLVGRQVIILVLVGYRKSANSSREEDSRWSPDQDLTGVGRPSKPEARRPVRAERELILLHRSKEDLLGDIADRLSEILGPVANLCARERAFRLRSLGSDVARATF